MLNSHKLPPWPTIGAVAFLSIPTITIILFNISLFFVFISVPFLFLVYRIYLGDNFARWVASALCLTIMGLGIYTLFHLTVEPVERGLIAVPEAQIAEMESSTLRSGLVLLCAVFPIVLMHIRASNVWFRKDLKNDA